MESRSERPPVPGQNVDQDAGELVKRARAFSENSTFQAAKAFADEWQSIVGQGKAYTKQVAAAAEKIANSSWDASVPGALAGKDKFGSFLTFNTTGFGHLFGATGGDLSAGDDGRVVAWPTPFKRGQIGTDFYSQDHYMFHSPNGKDVRLTPFGTEIGSFRWITRSTKAPPA